MSIVPLGTNFSEILIKLQNFSFTKMPLKISSAKWQPFCPGGAQLTHWGRVTHICVSKLTIIGPDNGLSPGRRQAIIWTIAGILLIGPLATNISEIITETHIFSFRKMHLKMSSAKWQPFCPRGAELTAPMFGLVILDWKAKINGEPGVVYHCYIQWSLGQGNISLAISH